MTTEQKNNNEINEEIQKGTTINKLVELFSDDIDKVLKSFNFTGSVEDVYKVADIRRINNSVKDSMQIRMLVHLLVTNDTDMFGEKDVPTNVIISIGMEKNATDKWTVQLVHSQAAMEHEINFIAQEKYRYNKKEVNYRRN